MQGDRACALPCSFDQFCYDLKHNLLELENGERSKCFNFCFYFFAVIILLGKYKRKKGEEPQDSKTVFAP